MHFPVGILIGACLLGGCSPSGGTGFVSLLRGSSDSPQLAASQSNAVANAEPTPPGEFIAPEQAPMPASRPDYGDRPKVDLVALARAEAALVALSGAGAPSTPNAARTQALAGSLHAYERREAGIPDDEDDDELEEIAALPTATAQVVPAQDKTTTPKITLNYTHAHFEIAGMKPLQLHAPRRWRAAYDNVETDCFPQQLRDALNNIAAHFNGEVLVTSGARDNGRRGSLHRSCKAADIRIVGVAPADLAAYARTVPGLNGVGAYRRVSVTHIDVRDERYAWRW